MHHDRLATQGGRDPSPHRPFHQCLGNSAAERPRAMTSTPTVLCSVQSVGPYAHIPLKYPPYITFHPSQITLYLAT
jgi:hypothetical protein